MKVLESEVQERSRFFDVCYSGPGQEGFAAAAMSSPLTYADLTEIKFVQQGSKT